MSRLAFTIAILIPGFANAALIGLVGRYDFNGNANDLSGNGNNGTIFGATLATDRFGNANKAFFFDGVNDYIEIPEGTAFDSAAFSISMWFRAASFPNPSVPAEAAGMLISKGQNNYEIHTGSEITGESGMKFLPRFVAHGVTTDWSTPSGSYSLAEWKHVVGVYNPTANDIRFYIDGSEVSLTGPAATPSAADNLLNLRLGMRTDDTLAFHGHIDDVRFYNRALTANEANQLFQVPEPSSMAFWAIALFGWLCAHRFAKKRAG